MSSIVDTKTGKFYKEFISFVKDIGTYAKHCKPKHPYTKGKDESANRFMTWLIPYNHEFEDEQELIKIIKEINLEVNKQVNSTIGVAPIMLYKKEKEYLKPLPNKEILKQYLKDTIRVKLVSNSSLFYYKGKRYSVPNKFIDHILDIQENDNKLYVYYNKELITIHEISEKNINYKEEHYIEGLNSILKNKEQEEIEKIAKANLENLNRLCEGKKMSNYIKLNNNLEILKLVKIKENIDKYIELINSKEKDVVDALYELTNMEINLIQERAMYSCVRTAGFPFIKNLKILILISTNNK